MRDTKGRFIKGNKKIGGFSKGDKHTKSSIKKISKSLINNNRAWNGMNSGYVAKHLWIVKHYGKATKCENMDCKFKHPKRFEWANRTGRYLRERIDYIQLCPSCHKKWDNGTTVIRLSRVGKL